MKALDGFEEMELSRFRKSYCLLVVIRVTVLDANTILLTNDEYARYEYVAVLVPPDTTARRESERVLGLKCRMFRCDPHWVH